MKTGVVSTSDSLDHTEMDDSMMRLNGSSSKYHMHCLLSLHIYQLH